VFKANRPDAAGRPDCAVKVLRTLDQTRLDRFANEIRILAELSHPSIAEFYGEGVLETPDIKDGLPWVAMDLGGTNLRVHVERRGILPIQVLRRVALQGIDALGILHSLKIIHRDLKPDNFIWTTDERDASVKMIDFGIAKHVGEDVSARPMDDFTRADEFVGPMFYSSPELIAYAKDKQTEVDQRSDLFQFGKTLWFLGTGVISAGVPAKRYDKSGGHLYDLVIDLLQDDPNDRPPSTAEVRKRIEKWPRDL
jgi:eukaryotic-like serine/threonine-protein kinase